MKFLYYETIFFICENKRIKEDKKTSHIMICVMIIIEKSYRKKDLFYINVKLFINVKFSVKLSFSQYFPFFKKRIARSREFITY